jgi:hypothetical protein
MYEKISCLFLTSIFIKYKYLSVKTYCYKIKKLEAKCNTNWYENCFFSHKVKIALRKLKSAAELEHALVLELVNKN